MKESAQDSIQGSGHETAVGLERSYDVDKLLELPQGRFKVEINAEEREALAQRAGLEAVKALSATLRIHPDGKGVHVWGKLSGEVTYICGVSLEPFSAPVSCDVDLFFQPVAREKSRRQKAREAQREHDRGQRVATAAAFDDGRHAFAPQSRKPAGKDSIRAGERIEDIDPLTDPPEPIHDGQIELGELLSEYFVLSLDPFPRKPGVSFDPAALGSEGASSGDEDASGTSPFAALARLQRPKDKK